MKLDEIRAERDDKIAKLLRFFGVIMAIFYVVMGLVFLYFPWFGNLPTYTRIAVAILLLTYGVFRFVRLIKQLKTSNQPNP